MTVPPCVSQAEPLLALAAGDAADRRQRQGHARPADRVPTGGNTAHGGCKAARVEQARAASGAG